MSKTHTDTLIPPRQQRMLHSLAGGGGGGNGMVAFVDPTLAVARARAAAPARGTRERGGGTSGPNDDIHTHNDTTAPSGSWQLYTHGRIVTLIVQFFKDVRRVKRSNQQKVAIPAIIRSAPGNPLVPSHFEWNRSARSNVRHVWKGGGDSDHLAP